MSKPNLASGDRCFPRALPSPLHSSCSNQRQEQTKPATASRMCEFRQNSPRVDTHCGWCGLTRHWPSNVRIGLSPEGQMSELGVRTVFHFTGLLPWGGDGTLCHSGGEQPSTPAPGDSEMGALVNEAGGWRPCLLKAGWCHE